MRHKLRRAVLLAAVFASALYAQTAPFVVGSGPAPPLIVLAPNELKTVYVAGLFTHGETFSASILPLPTALGGVSLSLAFPPVLSAPVPLVSVTSIQNGQQFTAITFQVTPEIYPTGIGLLKSGALTVSINGMAGAPMPVVFAIADVQIVKNCTLFPLQFPTTVMSPSCTASAQHADGSAITPGSPAKPGETVVLYGTGLGPTSPIVPAGTAPSSAAALFPQAYVDFTFGPGAPLASYPSSGFQPAFVGLVPGYVGLYQINIPLPTTFPSGIQPCLNATQSNLTITINVQGSFDGGGICVAPS